jgi:hypothetical protein
VNAISLALVAGLAAPAQPLDDPTIGVPGSDLCAQTRLLVQGEIGLDSLRAAPNTGDTDVLHNDLDIEVDYASNFLGGANTMTVRSAIDGLTAMEVRLRQNYTISSVTVDGAPAAWSRLSLTTIEVTLPAVMNTDDVFDLRVEYGGTPINVGFGSINYTTHNGAPYIFTLSEPWYAYSWWPAKDDNLDKATADIRVTAPSTMLVASNGLLVSQTALSGGRTAHQWSTTHPMATYLASIAATNFNHFSATYNHTGGSMPLEFYIYPESDTPQTRDAWLQVIPMLDTFGALFGPYPFLDEKYGIYQFEFQGGMEHQTMTGQGGFGLSLTAHELAHQWWGDNVTCATWSDIWLNEGFATYSEALWEEFQPGGTQADLFAAMAARRPKNFNGSTYIPSPTDPNRIFSTNFTYRRGAWILHMLRYVIGDQNFFDALAAYRAGCQGASATTEDFRAAVESVTGTNLSGFFNQWVYGVGAPHYEHAWADSDVNGQRYLDILIRQTQPGGYEPVFAMPIEFDVETTESVTRVRLDNDAADEHLLVAVDGPVLDVVFDPDVRILAESVATTPYTEGPPRIVGIDVAPGASLLASQPISVTFLKDVLVSASDVSLDGPGGSVPIDVSYNAGSHTLLVTPQAPLQPGAHTLTIADTVVDVATAQPLDGETPEGALTTDLITGDGVAGGDATFTFITPTNASLADLTGDGSVNGADLAILLAAWGASGSPADLNGDSAVDGADLAILLSVWGPVP